MVRDLGGMGVNVSLWDVIDKGYVVGLCIVMVEKVIGIIGGYVDLINGMNWVFCGDFGLDDGVVNSVEDVCKVVWQCYKNGVDCIKIIVMGGVLSVVKDGSGLQFVDEELDVIVVIVMDYGMYMVVYVYGKEGMM